MRAVLILVAIVVVLALLGWITIRTTGNSATVTVDSDQVDHDTHGMLEKGGEAIERVGEKLQDTVQKDHDAE